MASTASLLFNIAANSDEAESTIKSFRALMSKDLGDLGGEFEEWSKDVFGSLTTVGGAFTAIGAAAATFGKVDTTRIEALDDPDAIAGLRQGLRRFWANQPLVFGSKSGPTPQQPGDQTAPRANS
jgi:hypothetical protein